MLLCNYGGLARLSATEALKRRYDAVHGGFLLLNIFEKADRVLEINYMLCFMMFTFC